MRRTATVLLVTATAAVVATGPALACGGLIGPRGSVNLLRTTTLAAYHDGLEHYVTSFSFVGGGGKFGSITPLPGVPTKVERGGGWTLQRLVRETTPVQPEAAGAAVALASDKSAQVLLEAHIDALDITVLRGGGSEVGVWAKDHGFRLPPDAPEVLDFYAARSPIFMAARFDTARARARGQQVGDGTPIHLTIPTDNPWVPVRILGLGKAPSDLVSADVFLLTDRRPTLLPDASGDTLFRTYDQGASRSVLTDLHNDKGMAWVLTANMWLTRLRIEGPAGRIRYDLAIDASGRRRPSYVAAGLALPAAVARTGSVGSGLLAALALVVAAALGTGVAVARAARRLPTV